jgi:HD-like signal output (HDOD) protein
MTQGRSSTSRQLPAGGLQALDRTAVAGRRLAGLVLADIAAGTTTLASPVADVTSRIRRAILSAKHPRRVARLAAMDPVISAKLLRDANLHARSGNAPAIETLVAAANLMGVTQSAGRVLHYARHENLDHPDPAIRAMARAAWRRAIRVSTLSYLLASLHGRFDPEQAALQGLLHNLGELALINRAAREEHPAIDAELRPALRVYAGEVGRELAHAWRLPDSIIATNDNLDRWQHQHPGPAEMVDLVLVARWHSLVGRSLGERPPSLDELPAFAKLALGEPSPQFSMQLLEATDNALALTERQLTSG